MLPQSPELVVYESSRRCCRVDLEKKKQYSGKAGWYTGGNSTCRRHIASAHYKQYHERCKQGDIKEVKAATPKNVLAARLAAESKEKKRGGKQLTLDGVARKIETPTAFSRPAILDAVAKHVAVGDQVLASALY